MNDSDLIERMRALHAAVPGEPSSLDVRVAATPSGERRHGRSIVVAAFVVVVLIGVGLVIRHSGVANPAASNSVPPSASGAHRSATVGLDVRCGDVLPVEVTVADATSGALDGPAGLASVVISTEGAHPRIARGGFYFENALFDLGHLEFKKLHDEFRRNARQDKLRPSCYRLDPRKVGANAIANPQLKAMILLFRPQS